MMYAKSLALFASAFTSTALAMGSLKITNKCASPIYYDSIAGSAGGSINELPAGQGYNEPFRTAPNGGGISIKVSKTPDQSQGKIAQVEYTLFNMGQPMVFYDLSYVDGNPFAQDGVTVIPSDGSCPTVNCPPGSQVCPAAYNQPKDDSATHGCSQEASFEAIFCSGGGGAAKRSLEHGSWNGTGTGTSDDGSASPTGTGAATTASLPSASASLLRHPHAKPPLDLS